MRNYILVALIGFMAGAFLFFLKGTRHMFCGHPAVGAPSPVPGPPSLHASRSQERRCP